MVNLLSLDNYITFVLLNNIFSEVLFSFETIILYIYVYCFYMERNANYKNVKNRFISINSGQYNRNKMEKEVNLNGHLA